MMEFTLTPDQAPSQGKDLFHLRVADPKSHSAMPGCMIKVSATMPAMGDGSDGAIVRELGEGRYDVSNVDFTMGGAWRLTLRCERDQMADEAPFDFEV